MGFKRLIKKKMNSNLNLLKVKIKRKVTFGNFPAGNLLARVIQYSEVKIKVDQIFPFKSKVF